MSSFFDGTLINWVQAEQMLRSKKTEHVFLLIRSIMGACPRGQAIISPLSLKLKSASPIEILGSFPGTGADQFDFMSGSLLMVLIASVSGVGQHLFGCKLHFFSSLDGRDQSLGVMMVRRFNVNMSDQGMCRGLIFGSAGFGDLNPVVLLLVAIIGHIQVGKDFAASPKELPGWV